MKSMPSPIKSMLQAGDRVRLTLEHGLRFPLRSDPPLSNAVEMRAYGLKRSGNHAIINWIFVNHPGVVCFLNFIRFDKHFNPYMSFGQAFLKSGEEVINYPPHMRFRKISLTRKWHLEHPRKECFICSYEDRDLHTVPNDALSRHHDECVGQSEKVLKLLILRDPFNCFASRMKRRNVIAPEVVTKWKEYAREFLGETSYLEPNKIPISYNRWCRDREYRNELADKLGLIDPDRGMEQVPNIGRGSSFDSTNFDGKAQAMKTDQRWRHYENDPHYRGLFADGEIAELSERIFGHLSGTETLLD